jgi:hypothetical protein
MKPKFDIEQIVWILLNSKAEKCVVNEIRMRKEGIEYRVVSSDFKDHPNAVWWKYETDLFEKCPPKQLQSRQGSYYYVSELFAMCEDFFKGDILHLSYSVLSDHFEEAIQSCYLKKKAEIHPFATLLYFYQIEPVFKHFLSQEQFDSFKRIIPKDYITAMFMA